MKNIILLVFTALIMVGCEYKCPDGSYDSSRSLGMSTVRIDSCEYVRAYHMLAHKGNCRYCKERREKELKELIRQIIED